MNVAVIDIGSNSIRYMGNAEKALITTRLARGLKQTGMLCTQSMDDSAEAVRAFCERADAEGLKPYAYATSAVRDAKNSEVFLERVKRECGLNVDVLSGEREAHYAFLGATCGTGGLFDIGGGSSQIVFEGYERSFPIGCVRASEFAGTGSFEEKRDRLKSVCKGIYAFARVRIDEWTGVGGTITTLGALNLGLTSYDGAAVSGSVLTRADADRLIAKLVSMGDERSAHPLLTDRHDVIIWGALLLCELMDGMGVEQLTVSDRDGMEGYRDYILARGGNR